VPGRVQDSHDEPVLDGTVASFADLRTASGYVHGWGRGNEQLNTDDEFCN